jgi:hypothetical protein
MSYYVFPQPTSHLFTSDDIAWLNEVILGSFFVTGLVDNEIPQSGIGDGMSLVNFTC